MQAIPPLQGRFIPTSLPFKLSNFKRKAGNILIVAPHPDDDVIGAGGTMALLAKNGKNVFSIYVTDGVSKTATTKAGEETARIREKEAMDALGVVKAAGGIFLSLQSTDLMKYNGNYVLEKIKEVIRFFLPESLYIPSPFERHRTHVAVTRIVIKALRQIRKYTPELWGYHIWGGVYGIEGTRTVDISKTISLKQRAIRMHKSQIKVKAYDEGVIGRNRYEAVFLETHGPENFSYGETFLDMQELLRNKRFRLESFSKVLMIS